MAAETQLYISDKRIVIIEKIIAILLVLWGLFCLYYIVTVAAGMINSVPKNLGGANYWYVLQVNHLSVILSILCVFGGFMLLFSDKSGWMLSVVSSIMYCISFFISSRSNTADTDPYAIFYKSYGITAILFLIISVVLFLKPFRQKYLPSGKTYLWLISLLMLLVIDKIIF
ncbi:hypothetical protein BH11BAC6_BH11BAC6_00460 [soil metagenome]